jgi:nicotinamide mononucleotide transporter
MTPIEGFAVVTGAVCVWMLARNQPMGWVVGLASVAAFAVVFYQARLFAEVGIQAFYFVTSLQAINIWLRGGRDRSPRPVGNVSARTAALTAVVVLIATLLTYWLLVTIRGAAPFWDALTTVVSLAAHIYLMWRLVESWILWIVVDVIYIPLYASRGLLLTSALYALFLALAVKGLLTFRKEVRAVPHPVLDST